MSLLTGRYELNKLTLLSMCGFIAQLVEHGTGIVEVMGSNPVEALIFFRLLLCNCLNWKIYCDDHTSPSFYFLYLSVLLAGKCHPRTDVGYMLHCQVDGEISPRRQHDFQSG